jgi:hypothetical protein
MLSGSDVKALVSACGVLLVLGLWRGWRGAGLTYLEEVQIAPKSCGRRLIAAHRHLSDHDNDDADE